MPTYTPPASPRDEINGYVYFARLCSKIRLHASGDLDPEFEPNMGKAMDLWACQFLQVNYTDLQKVVLDGASVRMLSHGVGKMGIRPKITS